ncbi:hypothetical protein N7G274_009953 [Stereocaulon virgatum]|uniref:Uncharacterized protein n=1 Tax=Stereocaulon virgatum TaxID=373712 RepID=A0ABR3ZXL5_9LECA
MVASRFPTNTAYTYTSSCVWKDAAGNYASLAYIPHRNGSFSFSADFPPTSNANEVMIPIDTITGRQKERILEGLTVSSDGTPSITYASALDQEFPIKQSYCTCIKPSSTTTIIAS